MQYKVILTYDDDKSVNIVLQQEQVKSFIEAVQNDKVFKNETTKVGFWTSTKQLRHIIVQPIKEEDLNVEFIQSDQPSTEPVPQGDGVAEPAEAPDSGKGG